MIANMENAEKPRPESITEEKIENYDLGRAQEIFNSDPPFYKNRNLLTLYGYLIACMVTSASWGFDNSLTNGLQSVDIFMNYFGNPSGATLGFYGACTSVGGIIGTIIGGPLIDKFGRRPVCCAGAVIVVGMALMQAFSTSFSMFTGAKMVLGFGAFLQQCSAPVLLTELVHPKDRVTISSLYNTSILIGLVIGAWTTFGTFRINSNWSWKIPCLLQIVLPGYQAVAIWLCPESPRWHAMKGRADVAKEILIKYHGNGVETSVVEAEMQEIIAGIESDKTQMKFSKESLQSILKSKGNRHRLWISLWTAVGSQCLGSSLVAVYLPQILNQVGLTSSTEKTLIQGLQTTWSWIVAVPAAFVIARCRRKTIFLVCTAGMTAAFVVWTALTERYVTTGMNSYGVAVVAMIFVFSTFSSFAWIPLIIAYPLEVVTSKQRGIFFSWTMFCVNTSAFIVGYINPIAIESLSWRYYIIQCVFNAFMVGIIYFTFVETHGLTLEETAVLFDGDEVFNQAAVAPAADNSKATLKP
ncbi:putative MFS hexose transporter [Paramyrothecium foliicola]|nr:putative MFS hexose transporter [Paramyrothecium foliicola]